jgi:hypothetical protein
MSRAVRPFIREFKNRSSRSSALLPKIVEDADSQMFLNLGKPPILKRDYDNEYQAALKAADEVFSGRISVVPVKATAPSPDRSTGRILPSLAGKDEARLSDTEEKHRSGLSAQKVLKPSSHDRKKAVLPIIEDVKTLDEQPAESSSSQTSRIAVCRRKRRPIQRRWVLKTELKAGQKWKRRLYRPTL